jgi:hypothetical protein
MPSPRGNSGFWIVASVCFLVVGACRGEETGPTPTTNVISHDPGCGQGGNNANPDPAMVSAGQQLVTSLGCLGCHQPSGAGQALTAIRGGYPSNLTSDPQTGIACLEDDAIASAILDGVGPAGPLCGMPHYRSKLSADGGADPEAQALAIVQFLRTLPPATNQIAGPCAAQAADAGTD